MSKSTTPLSALVSARDIQMSFEGVTVLKGVSLDLRPGEVHALMGENGAGKSTLARIIAGIYRPRGGHLEMGGQPIVVPSPHAATALGIALIHQEPQAFPDLSVAENIFVGSEPVRAGRIDWRTMERRAGELLASLGLDIDPRRPMRGVSVADAQMVSVAAALGQHARVLLMDEPTAALTPAEVDRLFGIMRMLREQGAAIAFISHRLEEVFEISDTITVLRDGEVVGERRPQESSHEEIIRMMVGRTLQVLFERPSSEALGPVEERPVLLEARNITRTGRFEEISFSLRAGEIVGMAGLVGAGRSDVAQALFGIHPIDSGEIRMAGAPVALTNPRVAMAAGLAYVPEDRQKQGLLMPTSITRNMTLPIVRDFARWGIISDARERRSAAEYVERLHIILRSVTQPVNELSGGNQQKVVLSKWLMTTPKVIVMDEPTRGIDVGAKAEVHRLMGALAAQGIAILMISSELPEVLAMSDRILVLREGRLMAEFTAAEATAEKVMAAATGQAIEPAATPVVLPADSQAALAAATEV
jgi:rhamnose transport system ATP-binding protein